MPIKPWKNLRTVLMKFEVERFVWLSYTQWSCRSTWCLESQIFTGWLVGDQDGDMASACMTGPSAIRSAVSSGSSVNYYSMAPAYEHRLTRPAPKIQLRFFGIQIDNLMGCVGQHLTCAMVALAQSLAGNSLSSVNLLRCIPNGRYKWKPFLELLSQVVCENVTTFASSGSTWNSMVSFCCVLSMYHHASIWLFIMIRFIYLYIVHSHISWTNRTSMMYNRWVMSHESNLEVCDMFRRISREERRP